MRRNEDDDGARKERDRPDVNSPARSRNYFARHWRGEFSLGFAFWVNGALAMFGPRVISLILSALPSSWAQHPGAARVLAGIWLGNTLLWFGLQLWSNVGIWRSSTCHRLRGGRRVWAFAAKGVVMACATLGFGLLIYLPRSQLLDIGELAFGGDHHGRASIKVASDGSSVVIAGALGRGFAEDLKRVLGRASSVRTIRLSSPGGRLYEAVAAAEEIRAKALDTRAQGQCYSACTLVFMAGQKRTIGPEASLAFHKPRIFGEVSAREMDAMLNVFRTAGVTPAFIVRFRGLRDEEVWFPSRDELIQYNVITADAQ